MKTIYKYDVPVQDNVVLSLPKGARVLKIAPQGPDLKLWALVDPNEKKYMHVCFSIHGTGHPVDPTNKVFIDTVFLNIRGHDLVFHVFAEDKFIKMIDG